MENSDIIWTVKKDEIINIIKTGKRSDGRKFDDYRKLELKENLINTAEGSCWIKMGDTQVIVGIKMGVGEPYPDSPDQGVLVTNTECSPIAAPEYYSGPPRENAIEIARVVDRGIREGKMIDFKKLCVKEGELVWTVLVDIHILDYKGNLIDAATLAAVKALQNAYLPELDGDKIIRGKTTKKLPIQHTPIACTFAKIADKNIIDPSLEEEKSCESRITISTLENGNVCAMQKSGVGEYTLEEIINLVETSIKKGKELRKNL